MADPIFGTPLQADTPTAPVPVASSTNVSKDDINLGVLIWVLGIFFPLLGPLIIWLIKKDDSPFIDQVGKNALNFHISYTIWSLVSIVCMLILIGFLMIIAVGIMVLVFGIIGAIKTSEGESDYLPWGSLTLLK